MYRCLQISVHMNNFELQSTLLSTAVQ